MANEIQELITDFQDFFQMIAPHIVGHKTATEKFFNTVEKLRSLPSTESRESANHTSESVRSAEEIQKYLDEVSDKYAFVIPYDGSNNFYDEKKLNAFTDGFNEAIKYLRQSHPLPTSQIEAKALELKVEDHYKVWFVAFQMYCANCVGHGYPKHESGASMTYWELADYFDNSPERKKYYDHVLRNGSWKEVKDFSAPQVNNGWREEKALELLQQMLQELQKLNATGYEDFKDLLKGHENERALQRVIRIINERTPNPTK